MNSNILEGKWKEFKGEIQTLWGELSFDDLEKTKGNLKSIAGLIEQQYGYAKEEVAAKLHEVADRLSAKADAAADETSDKAESTADTVKAKVASTAANVKAKVESKVADVKAAVADTSRDVKVNVRDAKNSQVRNSTSNY